MPDYGLFTIDRAARTASGYLLPWGVKSKGISSSHTAPITFPPGAVAVPRDPASITLNDEHGRFDQLARGVALKPDDVGIHATFSFFDTDEADSWLASHADAAVYFSAEIADMTRAPGDIGAGRLAGAAVTTAPAFEGTSAALFSLLGEETAIAADPDDDEDNPAVVPGSDDDDAPASPDTTPDDPAPTEGEDMADAVVPATAQFSRRPPATATPRLTKEGFFSALHTARKTGDHTALRAYLTPELGATGENGAGMFALSNVTYDDASGLAYQAGIPSTWLGELAAGARFERIIVPLLTPGVLKSLVATGWVWTTKPSMGKWAGNKTPIPSNAPAVGPKDFTAQRFAGGHDLAREYYDFNVTEVIDSYVEAMVDSYYVESDDFALDQLTAGATAFAPTSATVSGQLAQMARAVLGARVRPTFALVAPDVFDAFTDVTNSDQSAYFSPTINLADGDLKGIPLIPDDRLADGQAIVGSKSAATAWELPGVPLRVSAPDLVLGGIDNAFFGYISVGVTYPAGVVKSTITLPTAPASLTAKASTK